MISYLFQIKEFAYDFEWIKSRGNLSATNARVDSNILHFQPFESIDIDVYTCVAKSERGFFRKSVAFDYDYNFYKISDKSDRKFSSPKIVEIYEHGNQNLQEPFEFECITDAADANITWYFNSTPIVDAINQRVLRFERLELKDEGLYQCIVTNRFGYDRKLTFIRFDAMTTTTTTTTTMTTSITVETTTMNAEEQSHAATESNHHLMQIIILSDPQRDHVENGTVRLKCSTSKIIRILF